MSSERCGDYLDATQLHKRLFELIEKGEPLPVSVSGETIYSVRTGAGKARLCGRTSGSPQPRVDQVHTGAARPRAEGHDRQRVALSQAVIDAVVRTVPSTLPLSAARGGADCQEHPKKKKSSAMEIWAPRQFGVTPWRTFRASSRLTRRATTCIKDRRKIRRKSLKILSCRIDNAHD